MPVCRHFSRADIIRTLLVITLAIGSIAAFGITVGVAASDPPETDQPDVVQMLGPVSQDKDLRDLATIPPTKRDEAEPRLMRRPFPQISSFLADDPYQIMRQPLQPAAMPAPLITFPGISSAQSTCGCLPPDTNGDVGPDHYIQAVNSRIKILDKSGAELLAPTTFNSFFSTLAGTPCANSNDGDGIVFYDHQSHRWVVSDFAFTSFPGTSFYQCIGVSKTADPVAGGWWLYWQQPGTRAALLIERATGENSPTAAVAMDELVDAMNRFKVGPISALEILPPGSKSPATYRAQVRFAEAEQQVTLDVALSSHNGDVLWSTSLKGPPNSRAELNREAAAGLGAALACDLDVRKRKYDITHDVRRLYLQGCSRMGDLNASSSSFA